MEIAKILYRERRYARSCFHAHQAAEKAAKALLIKEVARYETIHSVFELLKLTRESMPIPDDLLERGSMLDRFYLPSRYPNVWPSGPSYVHYAERDAKSAIESAALVVDFVRKRLKV